MDEKPHPLFCVCDKCCCRIAMEHRKADEACGRDWDTGGCQCGACRLTRRNLADIHASFARITNLENELRRVRAVKNIGRDEGTP